jgi:hypothetical protein
MTRERERIEAEDGGLRHDRDRRASHTGFCHNLDRGRSLPLLSSIRDRRTEPRELPSVQSPHDLGNLPHLQVSICSGHSGVHFARGLPAAPLPKQVPFARIALPFKQTEQSCVTAESPRQGDQNEPDDFRRNGCIPDNCRRRTSRKPVKRPPVRHGAHPLRPPRARRANKAKAGKKTPQGLEESGAPRERQRGRRRQQDGDNIGAAEAAGRHDGQGVDEGNRLAARISCGVPVGDTSQKLGLTVVSTKAEDGERSCSRRGLNPVAARAAALPEQTPAARLVADWNPY